MRVKNHDQRKGQWLINAIRGASNFDYPSNEELRHEGLDRYQENVAKRIEFRLWNMENDEFDKLMEDYNK